MDVEHEVEAEVYGIQESIQVMQNLKNKAEADTQHNTECQKIFNLIYKDSSTASRNQQTLTVDNSQWKTMIPTPIYLLPRIGVSQN